MKKIMFIFGTRPEAIKMAPVIIKYQAEKSFETKIVITGQHREMLDQVMEVFGLDADYDLNVMTQLQGLNETASKILSKIDDIYEIEKPDLVLVHGDTLTTICAAQAAFYRRINIGHIEAGLRSGDKFSPWPEEGNRRVVGALADLHFAPTQVSRENLLKDGISDDTIFLVGNSVVDAVHLISDLNIDNKLEEFEFYNNSKRYVLITAHRRENFGHGIESICAAVATLAKNQPEINFVFSMHLNPVVRVPIEKALGSFENVFLIEPQPYDIFIKMIKRAYVLLTDSGGLQEEAPALSVPLLLMRERTERPELISSGAGELVGSDPDVIVTEVEHLIKHAEKHHFMSSRENPFGDGKTSEKVIMAIKNYFSDKVSG